MIQEAFAVGQLVALRANRSRSGPIIEVLAPQPNLPPRYKVFHSVTEQYTYDHDQLVPANAAPGEPQSHRPYLPVREFRARLTSTRLAHPQVDTLYALRAARIKFIPYQMKPLMRILQAERPRLLIADEVGVGKTIEAGLILKEIETRQTVERVLVVCPKALSTKWRAEMHRFDEDFYILGPHELRHCIDETSRDGEWPSRYSRCIVPLELIRGSNYLDGTDGRNPKPGLRNLDPPATFDLIIIDEAHHVRNDNTRGWELARELCDNSEAVLFLSATPVQIGSSNLFTLLNLLRPDAFQDISVFNTIIE
ncbi:MAG: DEAD/DEAH box helicase, partial [Gammaproteobacteria bacterium]|nr:DEAD/DEAH box helicase [Gammaproteobacteria bacterium]